MKVSAEHVNASPDQSSGPVNTADIQVSVTVNLRSPLPDESSEAYLNYCERMFTHDLRGQIARGLEGLVDTYRAKNHE